jgi:phosphate/sulfate permease
MMELTRWETFRAIIAKWIVVHIASRISAIAVVSLMLEVHDIYFKEQEAHLENMEVVEPDE